MKHKVDIAIFLLLSIAFVITVSFVVREDFKRKVHSAGIVAEKHGGFLTWPE